MAAIATYDWIGLADRGTTDNPALIRAALLIAYRSDRNHGNLGTERRRHSHRTLRSTPSNSACGSVYRRYAATHNGVDRGACKGRLSGRRAHRPRYAKSLH